MKRATGNWPRRLEVELTDHQAEQLCALFDHAVKQFKEKRPGMVIAQLLRQEGGEDHQARAYMRVGFVAHETARLIQKSEKEHHAGEAACE